MTSYVGGGGLEHLCAAVWVRVRRGRRRVGRVSGSELESVGECCVHGLGARTNGRLGRSGRALFFQEAMRESFRIRGFGSAGDFVRCWASKQESLAWFLPGRQRLRLGNQSTVDFLSPRDSLTCRAPRPYSRVLNK